jgi:hypothetical protein
MREYEPCDKHKNKLSSSFNSQGFYLPMRHTQAASWLDIHIYHKVWCDDGRCNSYHKAIHYFLIRLLFKLKVMR